MEAQLWAWRQRHPLNPYSWALFPPVWETKPSQNHNVHILDKMVEVIFVISSVALGDYFSWYSCNNLPKVSPLPYFTLSTWCYVSIGTNKWRQALYKQEHDNKDVSLKSYKMLRAVDGFQMSIKHLTTGGQTCDQEAAVQQTFHLERSIFFYLSVLIVRTRCSALLACIFAHNCTKCTPWLLPSRSEAKQTIYRARILAWWVYFQNAISKQLKIYLPLPWGTAKLQFVEIPEFLLL